MIKRLLLLILCILPTSFCSTFKLNFDHNSINKFDNLFKNIKKTLICTVSPARAGCKINIDNSRVSDRDCTVSEGDSRACLIKTDCTPIEASKNASFDTSIKLQKYKPLYKIIYQLQLSTTIRFKSLLIIFIFLRTVYSLYNNMNDVVFLINIIDEKDIKEVKKGLELLSFINVINIFNIITFLELYDISGHVEPLYGTVQLINKKSLLYRKYLKLYKKDCFMIKYM
jgi:hypothetical protein